MSANRAIFNLLHNEWEVKVLKWGYNNDITGKCKIHWKTQIILALKNAPSYI
jgi:hypothetical protein